MSCSTAIVLAAAAGPAIAQQQSPQPAGDEFRRLESSPSSDTGFTLEVWQPIDQRVEDLGSLNYSLRVVERGLEQPNDFNQVYRLPGSDDRFMRVQGAIHAVFPQSAYSRSRDGQTLAHIPAGTEFYIGSPTARDNADQDNDAVYQNTLPALPPQVSELRWNTRIAPISPDAPANSSDDQPGRGDADQPQSQRRSADDRVYSSAEPDTFERRRLAATGPADRSADRWPNPRRAAAGRNDTARDGSDVVLPRMRTDDGYRRQRLRDLLSRAASAAQNSAGR